jgi:tetratricopeptide (TPR) repeat protein
VLHVDVESAASAKTDLYSSYVAAKARSSSRAQLVPVRPGLDKFALVLDRLSERLSRQTFDMADGSGAAIEAAMALANLAWLCIERSDYSGARKHIEIALPYAGKVQDERLRSETEAQVLTVAAMISTETGQLGDARNSVLAVLSRGEVIASPRVQLGALDNLALIASYLGRWVETAAWAEQARVLADRLQEATTLRFLGSLHLRQGDAQAASPCCARALALHQALAAPLEGCAVMATAALCGDSVGSARGCAAQLDRVACPTEQRVGRLPSSRDDSCALDLRSGAATPGRWERPAHAGATARRRAGDRR